jgi:DnaJ-class molecular chaperone
MFRIDFSRCSACQGTGFLHDRSTCAACKGLGYVFVEDDEEDEFLIAPQEVPTGR